MSKLYSFFGLNEMARHAGSLGKIMRTALETARQYGNEFTVKQFCGWLIDAGAEKADPGSVGQRLSKMYAKDGERPNALKPLIRASEFNRGPGGTGLYKYVFDGPAGAAARSDLEKKPKDDDDIPFDDDDAITAPKKSATWPKWLPKADPDGSYDQEKMAQLDAAGHGFEDDMWDAITKADDSIAVHRIVKDAVPPQLQRAAIRVAQEVFKNLNKTWDAKAKPLSQNRSWVDDDETEGSFSSSPDDDDETPLDDDDVEVAGDDFEDEEDTVPGVEVPDEEPESDQAGASNFLKSPAPTPVAAPKKPAVTTPPGQPKPKSSVAKFFRR